MNPPTGEFLDADSIAVVDLLGLTQPGPEDDGIEMGGMPRCSRRFRMPKGVGYPSKKPRKPKK